MTHLALEDRFVYPAMQKSPDPHRRAFAAQLQDEIGGLAVIFSDYVAAWNEDRIVRDWSGFCDQTIAVLDALEARVAREDAFFLPASPELDYQQRA